MPTEKNFELGRPVLVCRWRLAGRTLPLENRHLRALSRRHVNGSPVPTQLVAWAKQHIEWTLADGAAAHPDGTLMLVVDDAGQAAMGVGPYEPLVAAAAPDLARRAQNALLEASETGVAPESLWAVRAGALVRDATEKDAPSGAATLVADLAATLGIPVTAEKDLVSGVISGSAPFEELFLTSDEHGIVPATGSDGPLAQRLAASYAKLLESAR